MAQAEQALLSPLSSCSVFLQVAATGYRAGQVGHPPSSGARLLPISNACAPNGGVAKAEQWLQRMQKAQCDRPLVGLLLPLGRDTCGAEDL